VSLAPNSLIAITGASGYLGTALRKFLTSLGHRVVGIGRARRDASSIEIEWDPEAGRLDPARLAGVDAVINLAGATIAQLWTRSARRDIMESRTKGTTLLARTLASLPRPPATLVSMSGVNYYGDRGDEMLDESSSKGRGFLADVTEAWEMSAEQARAAGIRVTHPRLAPVMGPGGGILGKLLPLFRLGLGGRVGSGRQWFSWISMADALHAIHRMLDDVSLGGVVNLVSPEPVTNAEFTETLARALRRPAFTVAPAFAVRLVLGELGKEMILGGQRAYPRRLLDAGFRYELPRLEDAFRVALAD
jgi:uncharacterized protein